MSSRGAGSLLLRHLSRRVAISTPPAAGVAASLRPPVIGGGEGAVSVWARLLSNSAAAAKEESAASKENTGSTAAAKAEATQAAKKGPNSNPVASSYWGIEQSKLVNKDGVEWKWSCFRPWETYSPDTIIDLKKHHEPKVMLDKIAYWTVKALRVPTDIFFQVTTTNFHQQAW
uniref:ubiquinol oxidase (non-electrogenic) n=1 Tax=Leersia perrieri TaxID=77586 RepID=A0A0D9VJV7_9ORYZ